MICFGLFDVFFKPHIFLPLFIKACLYPNTRRTWAAEEEIVALEGEHLPRGGGAETGALSPRTFVDGSDRNAGSSVSQLCPTLCLPCHTHK